MTRIAIKLSYVILWLNNLIHLNPQPANQKPFMCPLPKKKPFMCPKTVEYNINNIRNVFK